MESSRLLGVGKRLCLVVTIILSGVCYASTDELAWGQYKGVCPSTEVTFSWGENDISAIVVNGVEYGTADLHTYGQFESSGFYGFSLSSKGVRRQVQFLILFDEEDSPKEVTGIYSESSLQRQGSSGSEYKMQSSCVMKFTQSPKS